MILAAVVHFRSFNKAVPKVVMRNIKEIGMFTVSRISGH